MRKQLARCLCAVMAVVMLSSGCTIKKSSEDKYGAVMETEKLAEKIKEKYAEDEKYEYTEPLKDVARDEKLTLQMGFDIKGREFTEYTHCLLYTSRCV